MLSIPITAIDILQDDKALLLGLCPTNCQVTGDNAQDMLRRSVSVFKRWMFMHAISYQYFSHTHTLGSVWQPYVISVYALLG